MKDLWLDIGAGGRDEAAKMVRIGDAVTWSLAFRTLPNQLAVSPAMDDKAGCWVVIEALHGPVQGEKLACGVFAVSTVQEELGVRGARTSSVRRRSAGRRGGERDPRHRLPNRREEGGRRRRPGPGAGDPPRPQNEPKVVERLVESRRRTEDSLPDGRLGQGDGHRCQRDPDQPGGVATGLISIPNRYMHSPVEMIALEDMDRAADLLARFFEGLGRRVGVHAVKLPSPASGRGGLVQSNDHGLRYS